MLKVLRLDPRLGLGYAFQPKQVRIRWEKVAPCLLGRDVVEYRQCALAGRFEVRNKGNMLGGRACAFNDEGFRALVAAAVWIAVVCRYLLRFAP